MVVAASFSGCGTVRERLHVKFDSTQLTSTLKWLRETKKIECRARGRYMPFLRLAACEAANDVLEVAPSGVHGMLPKAL
jgi:hypothetical protein